MLWPAIAILASVVAVMSFIALGVMSRLYEDAREALDGYERRALRIARTAAR